MSSSTTHIKATILVHLQQIQSYNISSIATHRCEQQIRNISYRILSEIQTLTTLRKKGCMDLKMCTSFQKRYHKVWFYLRSQA